jgi:dTDP-4-dehydrorhamnose 3,5-epimerase
MPFNFQRLEIPDLFLVEAKSFNDDRGSFLESYKESDFILNGINTKFVQDNISHSKQYCLRGLHYQKNPKAQAKLVTVIQGKIFDVAVDIRRDSVTFGRWVSEILSAENHKSLFIPEGFAHGFCVLSENADVLYKVNSEFSSNHERGIIWDDLTLNIDWPTKSPLLSKKDSELPSLDNIDNNF